MNKQMKVIGIVVAVVILGLVYWVLQEAPPKAAELPSGQQPVSYTGNTLSEEKDGRKIWELTAEIIEVDVTTKNTVLRNIQGIFYQENGETVTIVAPKAFYDVNGKNIVISENVKAVSSNGAVLNADEVRWDSVKAQFTGEGNVKLTQENMVITGDKLESSDALAKIKVTGNAHIVKGGK